MAAHSLRSTLDELAASFAESIMEAVRSASLHELVSAEGRVQRNGRGARSATGPSAGRAATRASGRLPRRSPEEIAAALGRVVSLVKKHKQGLRAEQIRAELGLQAKEMPRILREGLQTKSLKSKGQKRATTYFAA